MRDYKLSAYQAGVLVAEKEVAQFFEDALREAVGLASETKKNPNVTMSPSGEFGPGLFSTLPPEKFSSIVSSTASFTSNTLFGHLNATGKEIGQSPISPAQLGQIIYLIMADTISNKIAKDLFEIVWTEGGDPRAIVEQRGMKQVTDTAAIEKVVDDIVAKNPDKVADARLNPKAIGWFVGQVMKSSGGKASPQAVNDILKRKLGL